MFDNNEQQEVPMKEVLILTTFLAILLLVNYQPAYAEAALCKCYCGARTSPPCSDNACKRACGWQEPSSSGGGSSAPAYDYEAERQRQEAERQRQLETERKRQREIEEQRKREEEAAKRRQEEFERSKQDALNSMKGISESELGIKDASSSGDLGLKEIGDTGKGGLGLKGIDKNKAVEEAKSNLYNTQQGTAGAVFDTKGAKAPVSSQPVQMSERVRKDPRMIKAHKKLADLQKKRQKLDEQRTNLAKERNNTKDPEKMKQLTKELDKVEKAYQINVFAVSNQTQKVEKLKRTIDAEVEKPVSGKQCLKGSGQ
jgi:hypothetical protein